jgi:hypothetical protein
VDVEKEERTNVDSVNLIVPRIVPAPHAIDKFGSRVRLSDALAVTNKVLLRYAAQSGLGSEKLPQSRVNERSVPNPNAVNYNSSKDYREEKPETTS